MHPRCKNNRGADLPSQAARREEAVSIRMPVLAGQGNYWGGGGGGFFSLPRALLTLSPKRNSFIPMNLINSVSFVLLYQTISHMERHIHNLRAVNLA